MTGLASNGLRFILLLAAATTGLGCDREPIAPASDGAATMDLQAARASGARVVQGEIGPGALYALFLPEDWNGDLVLYAHGYVPPFAPLLLPDAVNPQVGELRDSLLASGYGVAWSSYAENGFAVKDGAIRTRQLRGLFASNFGRPGRTYLVAHSLGAAVAMHLAETNARHYDGALPICGIVGGVPMELNHFVNVRVLFDYFYPGVIPGTAVEIPDGLDFGADVVPAVVAAIQANPAAAAELAEVDQVEIEYADFGELVESILTALFFNTSNFFIEDVLERTHGHHFFDNSGVAYTGSSDDGALNAGVARFEAHPDALRVIEHWYDPTGELSLPVLTLHTRRDPTVPLRHETAYAELVAAAEASALLTQRVADRFGHCAFDLSEELRAFADLVAWVKSGASPGGADAPLVERPARVHR